MIQVLERFAKIMNHVSAHDEAPCRLRDLAAMLGVSPSACANIVSRYPSFTMLETILAHADGEAGSFAVRMC